MFAAASSFAEFSSTLREWTVVVFLQCVTKDFLVFGFDRTAMLRRATLEANDQVVIEISDMEIAQVEPFREREMLSTLAFRAADARKWVTVRLRQSNIRFRNVSDSHMKRRENRLWARPHRTRYPLDKGLLFRPDAPLESATRVRRSARSRHRPSDLPLA